MSTILLTAAGSASAGALLSRYRELGHRVVCCDIYPRAWNVTCCEADVFFQAVSVASPDYLPMLEDAVARNAVDFLIPLTDVEVDVLCAEKERFAALGCTVCTPDEACVRLCRNKLASADLLRGRGICATIPTYPATPEPPADFPLMLKPVSGRSSQGLAVVRDAKAYAAAVSTRDDYIVQPFLTGSVCTVETARDREGHCRAVVRRELLRTVNGLGTTVSILPGHPLEETCANIAAAAGIVGVVNMEFIEHDGIPYFLEINPRFSGGVGFLLAAGADFAAAELAIHQGALLPPFPQLPPCTLSRKITMMVTE